MKRINPMKSWPYMSKVFLPNNLIVKKLAKQPERLHAVRMTEPEIGLRGIVFSDSSLICLISSGANTTIGDIPEYWLKN